MLPNDNYQKPPHVSLLPLGQFCPGGLRPGQFCPGPSFGGRAKLYGTKHARMAGVDRLLIPVPAGSETRQLVFRVEGHT